MTDIVKKVERSFPTDIIRLTHESDKMLTDLWSIPQQKSTGHLEVYVPSDLFHVGTVPLLDCKIIIDETADLEHGVVTEVRVKIFPEFHATLTNSDGADVMMGAIQYFVPTGYILVPLYTRLGKESIAIGSKGWINQNGVVVETQSVSVAHELLWQCLTTWYGIQIALLHPVVKNVFATPARLQQKTEQTKSKKHGKRTPVKYVKRHIINQNELKDLVYGKSDGKNYCRKALIWYVIGHWRTYKNGHKVFIQPYWKGALRDTGHTKSRERELILQ